MPSNDSQPGAKVAFEIDRDLHARMLEVVAAVRQDPADRQVVEELIELIVELTDSGLAYFFLHPLELVGVGALRRKGVEIALATAGRVLPSVVHSTVSSMSETQLLGIADFIEHMMTAPVEDA